LITYQIYKIDNLLTIDVNAHEFNYVHFTMSVFNFNRLSNNKFLEFNSNVYLNKLFCLNNYYVFMFLLTFATLIKLCYKYLHGKIP